ncbi:hypothetical protein AVEN_139780-1 [Araneus ventricosus]|uniref:Uncharacterized protein n=1 Tax=Araneus ventricosus TaxID=182803 RepID=A0A4Y2JBX9_ARAVE|nr:hypothetical protein AVEN_139780-1 [Araneus ventricosus]
MFALLTFYKAFEKLFRREQGGNKENPVSSFWKKIKIQREKKNVHRSESMRRTDCAIVNEVLEEAKQSWLALNVDPSFKDLRKKKRFFDEKCEEESSEISQHKKFKLASLQVNDRITAELERRFQSMQKVNDIFGFLSPKQLTTLDNKTLREKATTLANVYRDDLDKDELSVEIESFKYSVIGSDNLAGNE